MGKILSGSLIVGALVPQVEVTFIMPSQTPGKENSGGDLESIVPDNSSLIDDIGGSSSSYQHAITARMEYSNKRNNTSNDVGTLQSDATPVHSMEFIDVSSGFGPQSTVTFKQQNGSERDEQKPAIPSTVEKPCPKNAPEEKPKLVKADSVSGIIPNNFNVNLSSMKKGFSNFMTSLDSALKSSPDDASNTLSIHSDASSDSENYMVASLDDHEKMDAIFNVDNPIKILAVEEASEVTEETLDTQSEKSVDSSCKRKDLVCCSSSLLRFLLFLSFFFFINGFLSKLSR
jgi:hypothetical protein